LLLTRMTCISLHMQWPLTSQWHGSFSQIEQLVFHYGSNSMPNPYIFIDLSVYVICFRSQMMFFCGNDPNCIAFNSKAGLNMAKQVNKTCSTFST
jgi:hypothetical protein